MDLSYERGTGDNLLSIEAFLLKLLQAELAPIKIGENLP
jgi:hypothetical protein